MLTIESLKVSADLTAVLADKGAVLKLEGQLILSGIQS